MNILKESKRPEIRYSKLRYKCRINKIKLTISLEEFTSIMEDNCFYCGKESTGLDRVDNDKGYVYENVVACCKECNRIKSNLYTCEETLIIIRSVKEILKKRIKK